jgi:hypothetical protein
MQVAAASIWRLKPVLCESQGNALFGGSREVELVVAGRGTLALDAEVTAVPVGP